MLKIILDTNVLVSSLIQKNYPYLIVEYCIEGNAIICISNPILEEYFEVLQRPKFAKFPDFNSNANYLLTRINELAANYTPHHELDLIKDQPDNRFLELAVASDADFLITGNTNDFTIDSVKKTKIVTPRQFWEDFKN
jgi:hypothetical protein